MGHPEVGDEGSAEKNIQLPASRSEGTEMKQPKGSFQKKLVNIGQESGRNQIGSLAPSGNPPGAVVCGGGAGEGVAAPPGSGGPPLLRSQHEPLLGGPQPWIPRAHHLQRVGGGCFLGGDLCTWSLEQTRNNLVCSSDHMPAQGNVGRTEFRGPHIGPSSPPVATPGLPSPSFPSA